VQVGGAAAAPLHRLPYEGERVVDAARQLGRDDVVAQRPGGVIDPFGRIQDEVALVDTLGVSIRSRMRGMGATC
jgi:hypothetical protein